MSLETLRDSLPVYAKDLNLNLSTLASDETLTPRQKWGTFLASAHAVGAEAVVKAIEAEAAPHLSEDEQNAARGAAALMGMNNIYYRFLHLAQSGDEYKTLRAGLRMNLIANPGADKIDFELWSLAVSAINGCGGCIDAHEATVRKHGLTTSQVQQAVKIASVIHAVSKVMMAEAAR